MSEATYLPKRSYLVGKRVNGGQWVSFGNFTTEEAATAAIENNRAFHLERCPNDSVDYSITD